MSKSLKCAAAVSAALLLAACGQDETADTNADAASNWPQEDIRIVVPYSPGGPTDTQARAIAPVLEEELGQTVIVENLPGASGIIGMNEMVSSEPDGYTMATVCTTNAVIIPLTQEDAEYDEDSFAMAGAVAQLPIVFLVRADSEYETIDDLLSAAQEAPGTISVGGPGASSQNNLELERMAQLYGTEFSSVPFEGNANAVAALLGGNIDALFLSASGEVISNVESGSFRVLATASEERFFAFPDAPTLAESGLEDITLGTSYCGMGFPAGTPDDVLQTVGDALEAAVQDPEVIARIGEEQIVPEPISGEALQEIYAEQRSAYQEAVEG